MEKKTLPLIEETKEVVPTPLNRGLILKNPITKIEKSAILLTGDSAEEANFEKLNKLFPDGVIRYEVLAVSEEVTKIKKGDSVVLNQTAMHRLMPAKFELTGFKDADNKPEKQAIWLYCNEGDVAFKY